MMAGRRGLRWVAAVLALCLLIVTIALAGRSILSARPASDATPTATRTPTATIDPTATLTPSPTPSPTIASTPTETPTSTPIPTPAATPTLMEPGAGVMEAPDMRPDVELVGRIEERAYSSSVTGADEVYRIYLPPDYDDTARRYPVLYLLHGWPYDQSHWDNLGVDEAADVGIRSGSYPPFIIVMPRADPDGLYIHSAGGTGSFEDQMMTDLLPSVEAAYRVSMHREGRAIGGISRGGVWSLEIGFRHPDAFAIVGAHSPALEMNQAPEPFDPFSLLKEPEVEGLRIYLDAGDGDWALPAARALHEALEAEGIDHEYRIHSGAHADALWTAYLEEYLAFYTESWTEVTE